MTFASTRPTIERQQPRSRSREHWRVPFLRPSLPPPEDIEAYFRASRSDNWYSNGGPCHSQLVARAGALLGDRAVVPVSSAGLGLILALRALTGESDDRRRQVLVPSFTFPATASAIVWCGLEPVFCDVDPVGWHLSVDGLRGVLKERAGCIAAIMACSSFGTPPPPGVTSAWLEAAQEAGVPLVIDSAAGLGADTTGALLPDAEVFSMHATKPLPVGEGGLVVLRDEAVAASVRILANHGLDSRHEAVMIGLNAKLDEWHCATALAGLDRLQASVEKRRAIASLMRGEARRHGLQFQQNCDLSAVQFVPTLMPSKARRAEAVAMSLTSRVELRTYFDPPLHRMPAFRGCATAGVLGVTDDLASRVVSLPMADDLTELEIGMIVSCLMPSN